jgi:hypothetical protein
MSLRRLLPAVVLLLLPVTAAPAQTAPEPQAPRFPVEVRLGLRAGAFEMVGSADSYDAVFGDPLPLGGADLEVRFATRWMLRASAEYGEIDGEQVLFTNPPTSTGEEVSLTYLPIHLSAGYLARPGRPWRLTLGAGVTLLSWETTSQLSSSSGTDPGGHAFLALERVGDRIGVGAELLYSSIPDAVGDAGATQFYGEDDLGGLALGLTVRWRVR